MIASLAVYSISGFALPVPVRISAANVTFAAYTLKGVEAKLGLKTANVSVMSIRSAEIEGLGIENLAINCDILFLGTNKPCPGGKWSLHLLDPTSSWDVLLRGDLQQADRIENGWALESGLEIENLKAALSGRFGSDQSLVTISWNKQSIGDLPDIPPIPEQFRWVVNGKTSGQLEIRQPDGGVPTLHYQADITELAFDSPEGRFAGEALAGRFEGSVQLDDNLTAQTRSEVQAGALLLDNFYTSFDDRNLEIQTDLVKSGEDIRVGQLRIRDGRSLEIEAQAVFNLNDPLESLDYQVDHLELHFPEVYENYLESMASPLTLDGLTVTGNLLWSGKSQGGVFRSGVLDVLDLTIVDSKRGRFAFTGLDAHILPGEQGFDSNFSWRGLLLQRINLGAGQALVEADSGHFALTESVNLGVLGGTLGIETLQISLPGGGKKAGLEPEIRLHASMDDMDMELLTEALGWPVFDGTISGKIPGVTLKDGVLAVEGEIEFNVFDGQILLSDLLIERPFGVLPSLALNLEAKNLDLEQLTHTFSFGQISGRMDGHVHDLRMLDWKPVTFDAWMGTPEQESGSNEISRKAVNHLTTIGGGSATAVLTGPVMRLFSNFSYKRLGLGCQLQNNICHVRGLDEDEASVLIMQGAGIPKIMIRAFNRQMDWPQLLGGLTAASEGESIQIGQ